MTTEQTAVFRFLGELAQAIKDQDLDGVSSATIMIQGIDYCERNTLRGEEPMTDKELAHNIVGELKANQERHKAWLAELDREFPTT